MLFTCIKSWFFRNHLANFHQISHWSFCWNVIDSLFKWSCSIDCQAHIFFFKTKSCSNDDIFISCDDRIGKILHNICMSAVAMSLRWANRGPWASCLLHSQVLENVSSAKYLGVQITDDLDWGQHINEIISKAFLHRNMAFAPRETKAAAYKTLIRPKLEYAAPVWMPHHQKEIDRIEKVQRTAARWTCRHWRNQSHVGEMLEELQWPTLQERRLYSIRSTTT